MSILKTHFCHAAYSELHYLTPYFCSPSLHPYLILYCLQIFEHLEMGTVLEASGRKLGQSVSTGIKGKGLGLTGSQTGVQDSIM